MFEDVEGQKERVDEGWSETVVGGRGEGEAVDELVGGGGIGAGEGAVGGGDGEGEEGGHGG